MNALLKTLFVRAGSYEGHGVNHQGHPFKGVLSIMPQVEGKGLTLDFTATGKDGTVHHKEHSVLGLSPAETLSLWLLSTNHPGVIEHTYFEDKTAPGAESTLSFRCGDFNDPTSFREIIALDLFKNGDVAYRYSWGMPGEELKDRSAVKMLHGKNRSIPRATLKETATGLVPEGEGWYILNAGQASWKKSQRFGEACTFEGDTKFEEIGINIHVIHPGQPNCHYHGEDSQEDFLVIDGKCRVLIEGQEIALKKWDFVHCPKWTKHVFVGDKAESCTIVMVGSRYGNGVIYPAAEIAKKYGACPEKETDSPKESYALIPKSSDERASAPFA